jgi:hypothetical protein
MKPSATKDSDHLASKHLQLTQMFKRMGAELEVTQRLFPLASRLPEAA